MNRYFVKYIYNNNWSYWPFNINMLINNPLIINQQSNECQLKEDIILKLTCDV